MLPTDKWKLFGAGSFLISCITLSLATAVAYYGAGSKTMEELIPWALRLGLLAVAGSACAVSTIMNLYLAWSAHKAFNTGRFKPAHITVVADAWSTRSSQDGALVQLAVVILNASDEAVEITGARAPEFIDRGFGLERTEQASIKGGSVLVERRRSQHVVVNIDMPPRLLHQPPTLSFQDGNVTLLTSKGDFALLQPFTRVSTVYWIPGPQRHAS